MCCYNKGYRIKKSQNDAVYFQPEDNHETRTAKREKGFKNYGFKHELKITFLFNFLRWTEEVETLGTNGGDLKYLSEGDSK